MAIMGAEVICRPTMLTRSFEIWELTNRARAYDNHVYMVACNGVGPDAGGNYYFGHSMIVDPIAHKLAQGRGTEEVVFAELNPDPIKFMTYGTKTPMTFDHLADRNLAAYRNILTPAKSRFEPGKRVLPQESARRGDSFIPDGAKTLRIRFRASCSAPRLMLQFEAGRSIGPACGTWAIPTRRSIVSFLTYPPQRRRRTL